MSPPHVPLSVIPTVVASAFYAELRTMGQATLDGRVAFERWQHTYTRDPAEPYEEPERAKARQDLHDCGVETFSACWTELHRIADMTGQHSLFQLLDRIFAPVVERSMRERDERRGQA